MEESRSEPGDGAAGGPQKCSTITSLDDANGAPVVAAEAVHVVVALEPKGGEDASEAVMEAVEESPSGAGAPTLQEPSVSDLPPPASPVAAASSSAAEGTPASSFNELLSSKIKFVKTPLQTKPVPQTDYASNGAQASKAAGKVVFRMDELRQMGKAAVRKESTWPEVLAGQYKECVCFDADSVAAFVSFLTAPLAPLHPPPPPHTHTYILSAYT